MVDGQQMRVGWRKLIGLILVHQGRKKGTRCQMLIRLAVSRLPAKVLPDRVQYM